MKMYEGIFELKAIQTRFFQLQITASVRKRPLRATWATTAAPTWPAEAFHEPTTFVVTETGFSHSPLRTGRFFSHLWRNKWSIIQAMYKKD